MEHAESFALNKAMWDDRAAAHAGSRDYAVERFAADPSYLSDVVRFDLPLLRPLLGDVEGLRGVHLQCHIGTDTVSLARLGVQMTGLDFSGASIEQARGVAARAGAAVDFVVSDVYDAPAALGRSPGGPYDLVFTGIGALCWLPDIDRWAGVVAELLAPGGRLFLREGHPMLWAVDEDVPDRLCLRYPYFEQTQPIAFDGTDTYVETDQALTDLTSHSWNHGLGEVFGALTSHGLRVTALVEHRSVPWAALPGRMVRGEDGEWRLKDDQDLLPLSYTMTAVRAAPGERSGPE